MDSAKQQLIDKLQSANNVLVTVSRDPSVDQLAACIGLTLLLNKQGKHAAAVFSGQVPSTLAFLKPDETLEKTTDSLRDFIIALDKSKADKLRYKVEDNIVRIFITPYKTSISEDDLEFSEGDFNVDIVVALGVRQQEELDEAITAHGRILHDATVTSVNTAPDGGLGSINWHEPQASSLSELVTELMEAIGKDILDNQIATALLTGIVSETDRFSNNKTSSHTMSISADLMAAGANQQLVASKLQEKPAILPTDQPPAGPGQEEGEPSDKPAKDDGVLEIDHHDKDKSEDQEGQGGDQSGQNEDNEQNKPDEDSSPSPDTKPQPDVLPADQPPAGPGPSSSEGPASSQVSPGAKLVTAPPSLGGTLTASSTEESLDPTTDPLSLPKAEPPQLFDHKPQANTSYGSSPTPPVRASGLPALSPLPAPAPAATTNPSEYDDSTLRDLEQSVDSPHVKEEDVAEARDEVKQALADSPSDTSEPIQALNAQPLGGQLHPSPEPQPPSAGSPPPPPVPPPIPFDFKNPGSSPQP